MLPKSTGLRGLSELRGTLGSVTLWGLEISPVFHEKNRLKPWRNSSLAREQMTKFIDEFMMTEKTQILKLTQRYFCWAISFLYKTTTRKTFKGSMVTAKAMTTGIRRFLLWSFVFLLAFLDVFVRRSRRNPLLWFCWTCCWHEVFAKCYERYQRQ